MGHLAGLCHHPVPAAIIGHPTNGSFRPVPPPLRSTAMDDYAGRVFGRSGSADRNCGTPGGLESAANGGRDHRGFDWCVWYVLLLSGLSVPCSVPPRLQWWTWGSESEQAVPDSAAVRGFGASQGSCDPVKVTRPELRIESGILPTEAGELHPHICAVTRRGERDLYECRCRRRCVGSSTVPSNQHAVLGIDFDVAAGKCRPVEVELERLPHVRSCHRFPSILTRPVHVQEARAVRVG